MEILAVLVVMVLVMVIAARFERSAGLSSKAHNGNEKNHSGIDDDWSTDPTRSSFVGSIWHDDD